MSCIASIFWDEVVRAAQELMPCLSWSPKQVSDLETELVKGEQAIAELHSKTNELQAQVDLDKDHLRRWKGLHDDVQSRNEIIQQAELQTRVALEACQARVIMPTFAPQQGLGVKFMTTSMLAHYLHTWTMCPALSPSA